MPASPEAMAEAEKLKEEMERFRAHINQLERDMFVKLVCDLQRLFNRHAEICDAGGLSGKTIIAITLAALAQLILETTQMRKE